MKHSREFEIAWQGLKPGLHTFEFEIGDRFMKEHEAPPEYKDWEIKLSVKFDKKSSFFLMKFDVDGNVTVPCDRCGDDYRMRLWDEFSLVIKLTDEETSEADDEDDVIFIPRSETVIDISNWLYEYIMLSIPLQKIHLNKPDGTPGCNPEALNLLNKLSEPDEQPKNDIWKGLEALKEKNIKTGNK